ncbi:hypothetical protein EOD39_13350 [Acipenser ruthenus]|uniref:Uncharacterized protein n=1 Tax=Acipenser ruthenus TaxID=7906 RepID=A0A662YNK1_ACIRT|nr:hypothetical protein EOD39_13350 [Acipenser ruthenus]
MMLTVNVYNNGTVMVQGRESSLDLFEHSFPALRERVEREKTIPELANPQPLPPPPAQPSCQPPHPQHSPFTDSPRQVNNIKALKECLSVLELHFTEFREHTEHKLATLSQASPSEQLRDEVHRLKTKHRAEVQECGDERNGGLKSGHEDRAAEAERGDEQDSAAAQPAEEPAERAGGTERGDEQDNTAAQPAEEPAERAGGTERGDEQDNAAAQPAEEPAERAGGTERQQALHTSSTRATKHPHGLHRHTHNTSHTGRHTDSSKHTHTHNTSHTGRHTDSPKHTVGAAGQCGGAHPNRF